MAKPISAEPERVLRLKVNCMFTALSHGVAVLLWKTQMLGESTGARDNDPTGPEILRILEAVFNRRNAGVIRGGLVLSLEALHLMKPKRYYTTKIKEPLRCRLLLTQPD
jgi:hypothetical protein